MTEPVQAHVPMPVRVEVQLTLRNDEPVVVLHMVDVVGDTRDVHLSVDVAQVLVPDLAVALLQIKRGARQMPEAWR